MASGRVNPSPRRWVDVDDENKDQHCGVEGDEASHSKANISEMSLVECPSDRWPDASADDRNRQTC
jgi:hypothetical protein